MRGLPTAVTRQPQWAAIGLAVFALNLFLSRYLFWDSYYDLAAGRYIAAHGIPHREVFTVEGASKPWIDQQWLAHWVYYQAWSLGGYPALAILSSALVAAGFAGLAALMTRRGAGGRQALVWTALAYVACLGATVIRAESFAYPLFVLVLALVLADSARRGFSWTPLALLFVLLAWANLHGTVALAAGLVCGYAGWRALKLRSVRYAAVCLLAPLTIFATPYGFSIRHYYSSLIANRVIAHYDIEWAAPSLGNPWSWGFFVVLAAGAFVLVRRWRAGFRPSPVLLAIAGCLLALAFQGVRYQAWFAIAGALLAADAVAGPDRELLVGRIRDLAGGAIGVAAVVALVVVVMTSTATFEQLAPEGAMAATGAFLEHHASARILADADSSSALLWTEPRSIGHVAFDARLEQFPQKRLAEWFDFMAMNRAGWQDLATGYDAVLVTRRAHAGLIDALELDGWRPAYADSGGALLVRSHSRV
jgi:hypothetical protein